MKRQLLDYLICPNCRQALELKVFLADETDGTIREGYLDCTCGSWFPVIAGVPRIFSRALFREYVTSKHDIFFANSHSAFPERIQAEITATRTADTLVNLKSSTAESFGYEWQRFNKMFNSYRQNFLNYVQPFTAEYFRGKVVMDAGCGVGRHTYWAAKFGAKDVIGVDLSDAVEPAEKNCRALPNAHIVQSDMYALPFRRPFDFICSIGVIHHLPDPEAGFQSIVRHVKPGGTVLIWVYGRQDNNTAVYVYEPMRTITRHIPKRILVPLCYPFAGLVQLFNSLATGLEPVPGLRSVGRRLPFQYYRNFPFEVKLNDTFDVLATPKSRYYPMETIQAWFDRLGLQGKLSYLRKKSIIAYAEHIPEQISSRA